MDDSKKSKGKNSSALPVLDPVLASAPVGVTSTDKESTGQALANGETLYHCYDEKGQCWNHWVETVDGATIALPGCKYNER